MVTYENIVAALIKKDMKIEELEAQNAELMKKLGESMREKFVKDAEHAKEVNPFPQ